MTSKQASVLAKFGLSAPFTLSKREAARLLMRIARNGWRRMGVFA